MPLTPIISISGTCVPVMGADMDTDRIIPARFLKCITFDELAGTMFWDERFEMNGTSKGHSIDDSRFAGASIIIGGPNFGCGSSREHAPQAIKRSGIHAIIAESFAEIFFGNSTGIGLPCICATREDIAKLHADIEKDSATAVTVNLQSMKATWADQTISITMPEEPREALIQGRWDSIAGLLEHANLVRKLDATLPSPGAR